MNGAEKRNRKWKTRDICSLKYKKNQCQTSLFNFELKILDVAFLIILSVLLLVLFSSACLFDLCALTPPVCGLSFISMKFCSVQQL